MLKENKEDILGYTNNDDMIDYKHTIKTVWLLTFKRIKAKNPATVRILEACVFLHPENIPVCLFKQQQSILELLPTSIFNNKESEEISVEKTVEILVKFSLLKEAEKGTGSLTMHRLVQKV